MSWKDFPCYWVLGDRNPIMTGGFLHKVPVMQNYDFFLLCCLSEQAVKQTSELPVIWDTSDAHVIPSCIVLTIGLLNTWDPFD